MGGILITFIVGAIVLVAVTMLVLIIGDIINEAEDNWVVVVGIVILAAAIALCWLAGTGVQHLISLGM